MSAYACRKPHPDRPAGCVQSFDHKLPCRTKSGEWFFSGGYLPVMPMILAVSEAFTGSGDLIPGDLESFRAVLLRRLTAAWDEMKARAPLHSAFSFTIRVLGFQALQMLDVMIERSNRMSDRRARREEP